MKKLNKLKLNNATFDNMSEKEMNTITGGRSCTCSCDYNAAYDNACYGNYYLGSSGGKSTTGSNGYTCG